MYERDDENCCLESVADVPKASHDTGLTSKCWHVPKTENRDQFVVPKQRKPIITRAGNFEKSTWREFYKKYVTSLEGERIDTKQLHDEATTEYFDKFGGGSLPKASEEEIRDIIEKYPIYSTGIISFYNPEGKNIGLFNRREIVTKKVSEQSEPFG